MMFLLQLVMCLLSFVNICWGMEKENPWEIENISRACSNPYHNNYSDRNVIQGHLQIYHEPKENSETKCCRFEYGQNPNLRSFKLSNFDCKKCEEMEKLTLLDSSRKTTLADAPLYIKISQKYEEKSAKTVYVLEVDAIKYVYESKKLLDMPGEFRVIAGGDNIFLRHLNLGHEYTLYHPENIENIRQALSSKKPFIIKIVDSRYTDEIGKVLEYTNGSYIHWKGWIPSFDPHCVGMPIDLSKIDKPQTIEIDYNKETEEMHYYYQRNKWISRGMMCAILLFIAYQLKDKIYNIGSLLQ